MFATNIRICIYGIHVFNYYIVNNANSTLKTPYMLINSPLAVRILGVKETN